jgi:outer membrane protein OmpA-like peptidoglycan-associated protein
VNILASIRDNNRRSQAAVSNIQIAATHAKPFSRPVTPFGSNQAIQRLLRRGTLQTKLAINQPGDAFEREADQVADSVMRMPDPTSTNSSQPMGAATRLQRCSCGAANSGGGECEECKAMQLQRSAVGSSADATAPPIVHEVLNSTGSPLDTATRSFMEPRFGHDFGNVRVHTGDKASESAKAVGALAYTVGRDIVFATGQYSTASSAGNKLLAHELAHTVQQGLVSTQTSTTNSPAPAGATIARAVNQHSLQRRCETFTYPGRTPGVTSVPGKPCVDQQGTTGVTGSPVLEHFGESSSSLIPLHAGQVTALQSTLLATDTVEIHGYASCDGGPEFNLGLSCDRAEAVKRALTTAGSAPFTGTVTTFAHGETDEFGGLLENRRVIIKVTHAAPPPPPPALPQCGPDVTDWFLDEINRAATDPAVLSVRSDLTAAASIAASRGTRAEIFADAGATTAVEAQEARLALSGTPPPARSGAIVGQLAAGSAAQSAASSAVTSALRADLLHPGAVLSDFAALGVFMASAALKWRALVNHGARFDFKAHILHFPRVGPSCPDDACPPGEVGIVTLCRGGSSPQNCYESDLPGNIFYALIGRHVGFSELTLQLGSQLAELTDLPRPGRPAITWDSPEDTAAIHLGFSLGASLPLARASLCGSVTPSRGVLDARTGCEDCTSAFPIHFV